MKILYNINYILQAAAKETLESDANNKSSGLG